MNGQQQEAHDTDSSDVDSRRGPRLIPEDELDYLERHLQDALARHKLDWNTRNSAYMQEVRGHLLEQDQRMASLETQSISNAGECLLFIEN